VIVKFRVFARGGDVSSSDSGPSTGVEAAGRGGGSIETYSAVSLWQDLPSSSDCSSASPYNWHAEAKHGEVCQDLALKMIG